MRGDGRSESRPERIEDSDIGIAKIGDVAGDDSQAMNQSSGCNQTVLDRHGSSGRPQISEEPCPPEAGLGCPVEAGDSAGTAIEPLFQPLATPARRQKLDPESQLTENNGVDSDLTFMATEPADDLCIRPRPRRLAEDIRIDEELHGSLQVVGRFRGDFHEEPLRRTRKQPVRQSLIGRCRAPPQSILAAVDPLDLKLLPGPDVILLPDGRRQNYLTFARDSCIHVSKISSYVGGFKPEREPSLRGDGFRSRAARRATLNAISRMPAGYRTAKMAFQSKEQASLESKQA